MSSFDSPERQSRSLFFGRAAPAQQFPLTPQMVARSGMPALTAPALEQADRRFDQMISKVTEMEQKLTILDQGVMAIKTQADQKVDELTKKQQVEEVRVGVVEQEVVKHMTDMRQKWPPQI